MESATYEDKPKYDIWIKAILGFPLVFILIPGLYSFSNNDAETAFAMLVTTVLIAIIYWVILPRKYCISDTKVKIMLGGPFAFSVPFATIQSARPPEGMSVGINFATSFSSKNAVQIVRKGKLDVNITPGNRATFLENLDKALNSWREYNTKNF